MAPASERMKMMSQTASPHLPRKSWGCLISTLLLVLAVLGLVVYGAITLGIALGWMRQPASRVAIFFIGSALGELAAFALLTWLLHRRGSRLCALGWRQPTRWSALSLGLSIAIVYSAYTALNNPSVGHHLLEFSLLKLVAVVAVVVAGVVEETIFRGYVITTLGRMGYGLVVQVLLSACSLPSPTSMRSPALFPYWSCKASPFCSESRLL